MQTIILLLTASILYLMSGNFTHPMESAATQWVQKYCKAYKQTVETFVSDSSNLDRPELNV